VKRVPFARTNDERGRAPWAVPAASIADAPTNMSRLVIDATIFPPPFRQSYFTRARTRKIALPIAVEAFGSTATQCPHLLPRSNGCG